MYTILDYEGDNVEDESEFELLIDYEPNDITSLPDGYYRYDRFTELTTQDGTF